MLLIASLFLLDTFMNCAAAQVPEVVVSNHALWNAANGFRGGHVYSIAQTSDGYLWIGTPAGLVRFDGLTFDLIRQNTSDAIIHTINPSLVGFATDADGQLWATNGLQMFRCRDGQLETGLPGLGPRPDQDIVISKAQDGALLFSAGFEGVFSYSHGEAHRLLGPRELRSGPLSLQQGTEGTLWIGTHTGLFSLSRSSGKAQTVRRIESLADMKVNALLPLEAGAMLVATDKGLRSWEGGKVTQVDMAPELRSREILALTKDLHGNIWIATESGLFKTGVSDSSAHPDFRTLDRLTDHSVTALFEDREGSMWVGGLDSIERYRENAFATYLPHRSPSENNGPLYVDEQARTWFAPSRGGLSWLRGAHLEQVDIPGMGSDSVYSIAGGGGEVWVGRKRGGLTRLSLHGALEARTYTMRDGLPQDSIYSVYRSLDGAVWAGTLNQGLCRLRHGILKTFTTKDGLPSNTISALAEGRSGEIFIGTPNGLGELKNGQWVTYTVRDGMPPGALDCLFTDSAGTLWIGTTKGLCFLRSDTIRVPSRVPDALSDDILGIAESDGGWLWISTPNRVLRVRKDALYGNGVDERDYREYGVADGLPSDAGVKRGRSVVRDDRGRVWFSLVGGISVVQPSILKRQSVPAAIHLESLLVDESATTLATRIRIPSGHHRLTFRFASVSLNNPDQVRYRYRLDDFDSAWSEPVTVREVNYTNLPPGKFRFRVMARNPDGLWSSREASVDLNVEPTYWQSFWFRLACFGALLLMATGIYRLRILNLTRRLNLLFDERVAERTRIGRELHDTLLQNLTGLSLQISGLAKSVTEPPKATEGLQQLKRQAEDCVRETRQSVWNIRSADADIQDLPNTLKHSGHQLTAGKGIRFEFACEGKPCELPLEVRRHLLRIAREAIGNAVRHAHANGIQLSLKFKSMETELIVRDDGIGFDFATKRDLAGHFGLATMTERAQQVGASIQFISGDRKGTSISVRVPRKAR